MTRIIWISILIANFYCCQKADLDSNSNFSEIVIGKWNLSQQTGWPDKEPVIYDTVLRQYHFKTDKTYESISPVNHTLDYSGEFEINDEEPVTLTLARADFEGVDFHISDFNKSFFIFEIPTDEGIVAQMYTRDHD